MAVDSYNATTGAPEFSDAGAPDLAVDPTAVAAYAADVGNRIVRANLAGLEAYGFKRQGLMGHASDTGSDYMFTNGGWTLFSGSGVVNITTFGANWTPTATYAPQVIVDGRRRSLIGAATRATGGSLANILTIPEGHRPAVRRFLSAQVTSTGTYFQLNLDTNGLLTVPTGYSNSTAPGVYPLSATWTVD